MDLDIVVLIISALTLVLGLFLQSFLFTII